MSKTRTDKPKPLTVKEEAFARAYALSKTTAGNGKESARAAGYQQTDNALAVTASELLRKPNVRELVKQLREKRLKAMILGADHRDAILSEIALDKTKDVHARIGAVKELNKVTGRHSLAVFMGKTSRTLEEILEDSREGE